MAKVKSNSDAILAKRLNIASLGEAVALTISKDYTQSIAAIGINLCAGQNSYCIVKTVNGGAHAQVFYPLLEYLELKTLIIADLDAVKLVGSRWKKCACAEGERTSNSVLKTWFDDNEISVAALQAKTPEQKTKG